MAKVNQSFLVYFDKNMVMAFLIFLLLIVIARWPFKPLILILTKTWWVANALPAEPKTIFSRDSLSHCLALHASA